MRVNGDDVHVTLRWGDVPTKADADALERWIRGALRRREDAAREGMEFTERYIAGQLRAAADALTWIRARIAESSR